jgi:hypothetical protein
MLRIMPVCLAASLLVCFLSGCSTSIGRAYTSNVDFSMGGARAIYWDEWVRKAEPQIFVSPDQAPDNPPTAVFMPFRVTQQMEHANSVGYNLSRIVWQTWLQHGVLPAIEFADGAPPYRPDLALAYGRQRKADLVIGGTINYFHDGGTVGDSAVSLSLEIYDVSSGNMLWSLGQAALMQSAKVNDYLLFATRSRMPTDPATACLTAVAGDLARMVRAWAYNAPPGGGKRWWQLEAF